MDSPPSGTLTLERNDARDIPMRALKVFVDGKYWLDIRFGTRESKSLPKGDHVIKVTNTLYSKQSEFHLEGGDEAHYIVGNRMPSVWASMLVLLGIVPYRVFVERVNVPFEPEHAG